MATSSLESARTAFTAAVLLFDSALAHADAETWRRPTPCTEWDARTLVNHVVGEALWAARLLRGETIAAVGHDLDGDVLGEDPDATWLRARDSSIAAAEAVTADALVDLSFGPTPAEEYLWQLAADHLIHAWDLAAARGQAITFPPEAAGPIGHWFDEREELYRAAGAIAAGLEVAADADPQTRLLARFGRDADWPSALHVVERFGAAVNAKDLDAMVSMLTPDCVFETTAPPDGVRSEGREAVRQTWAAIFADSPEEIRFTTEDQFAAGDRVAATWRYDWGGEAPGHVRGVDLFRIRAGQIAQKSSYVKG